MRLSGKKILITGADGFIGSHLTEALLKRGANITALVQYNSFNYWGWLEDTEVLGEITVVTGDVRDAYFLKKATKGVDIVFNLAALIAIPYSYLAPDSYVETNVKGALNICQAALENNVKKIIHTSTSEVYGTAQYVPIDEKHPLGAQSPYAATKVGADAIVESFYRSFGLPVAIARPFNTYGPRQSARAVIPTIITQMANGHKKIKLGDTRPTRDFSYVLDTCEGLIRIAESEKTTGEVINIGSNYEISIADTFSLIKRIMHSDAMLVKDKERLRPDKSEVLRLWCDNSKIRKLTGFKPRYSLEAGLKETISWFKNSLNLKKYKEDIYNV